MSKLNDIFSAKSTDELLAAFANITEAEFKQALDDICMHLIADPQTGIKTQEINTNTQPKDTNI